MSISEDMETIRRHRENGTLREYMEGSAKPLPAHERETDPSAAAGLGNYEWLSKRGE